MSGTLPHDYDMVMGIAPVEPQESERFEEGSNSDFQDVEDTAAHSPESLELPENATTQTLGPGEFHGGYGNASLRECVERVMSQELATPATRRSGEGLGPNF